MIEMLAGIVALTVSLVLFAGFAGHLLDPTDLPRALTAHATVPASLIVPTTIGVILTEGTLGALGGYSALAGRTGLLTATMTGAGLLLSGYAAYSLYVLCTRPPTPCGCAGAETPMSGWVAGRAAVLAVLAAAVALRPEPILSAAGPQLASTVLAASIVAVLLWLLPTMMADPEYHYGRAPSHRP